jgi:hypothetical protein
MGEPTLGYSPIQLKITNQHRVFAIGRLKGVTVDLDGVCTKVDFEVIEIDQRFKRLKGKLKYAMNDMKYRHLFVNSLLPHLKYPSRQQKFQTQEESLQAALQLE